LAKSQLTDKSGIANKKLNYKKSLGKNSNLVKHIIFVQLY